MQNNTFIRLILILFLLINIFFFSRAYSTGGITTDGTLGLPVKVISAPNSKTDVVIKQSDGLTKGGNLFHSFAKFNIASGQTVTFAENDNAIKSLDNVISRVTDGKTSDINGLLRVTPGGKANFYLINPSGITFGPDAQVDVPGSIHVSTADQLKFTDGKVFSAVHPTGNSLSSAAPSAFGFLGTSTTNNGLLKISGSSLILNQGTSFDAVAGHINLENSSIGNLEEGIVDRQTGVRMVATQGSIKISIIPNIESFSSLTMPLNIKGGDIEIKNSNISVSGSGGGLVYFRGSSINIIENSNILVTNSDLTKPNRHNGIWITSNDLTVKTSGSLQSDKLSDSNGISADININTFNNFKLDNGFIAVSASGQENSGNINIRSEGDVIMKNSSTISTEPVVLENSNKPGSINISARGNIELYEGSVIQAKTHNTANAGNIAIFTEASIILDKANISSETMGSGEGGNISINAQNILFDNTTISSSSNLQNSGKPGNIEISANDRVNLSISSISTESKNNNGGNVLIKGINLINLKNSSFTTTVEGIKGNGGNIHIVGDNLVMETGLIQANTSAKDASGGNITLDIKALVPSGNQLIIGGSKNIDWKIGEFGFNVIQAAAPSGISGIVRSTAPILNLSGSLANLGSPEIDQSLFDQEHCSLGMGSSLIRFGTSGIMLKARDPWLY